MTLKKNEFNKQSRSKVTLFVFKHVWALLSIFLIFKIGVVHAQLDNYWAWDNHSFDFSYNPPLSGLNGTTNVGNGSSICDSSGHLIFYCSPSFAYDRKNREMPYFSNSRAINCDNVIVIPKNEHEYYIFGTQPLGIAGSMSNSYLLYTLIDMRLNMGYGDAESGLINQKLYKSPFYTVGAARKKGGGYWLLSKTFDSIYAFPVDSNGIGRPVKSRMFENILNVDNPVYDPVFGINQYWINTSHDNKMVITTSPTPGGGRHYKRYSTIYAYDFDNATGIFSNQRLLAMDSVNGFKNSAFSPDDSQIYVGLVPPAPGNKIPYPDEILYQFQRYGSNIAASLTRVYSGDSTTQLSDIKSAPDGKIYFSYMRITPYSITGTGKLGVIRYPNRAGNACGLTLNGPNYLCPSNIRDSDCISHYFPLTIPGLPPPYYTVSGSCGAIHFSAHADTAFTGLTWYIEDANGKKIDSLKGKSITYSFANSGKYIVVLQGSTKTEYKSWFADTITYYKKPVASFSFLQGNLCQYNQVQFTDHSKADTINATTGQSWHWDFGDGGFSTMQSPPHAYAASGNFDVKLTYSNGFCSADTQMPLKILTAPKPGFTVSDSIGCTPVTVKITPQTSGTIVHINYDLGNGTNDTTNAPTVVYNSSGNYKILQKLMGPNGCVTKDSALITVKESPITPVYNGPASVCMGSPIQLGNLPTKGYVYNWTSIPLGFASSISNPVDTPKTSVQYNLKETLSASGCSDSININIRVLQTPKPGFSVSDSVGCQPLTVKLKSLASGTITKTYYDFGNGTNASTASPTVDYNLSGNYKILQEVTGPNGCVTKDSATIKVNPTPNVVFQSTDSVCLGTEIEFGFPSATGYTYSWNSVPKGFISSLSKPIDVPTVSTTYNLKETISATGCSDSGKVLYCFVEKRPVASFSYDHTRGFDYRFAIKRSKNVSYHFDFGDGKQVSLNKNDTVVSHSFPGNGKYIVILSALSDTGLKCESTFTDTIIVNEPFSLNIFPNPFSLKTDINYMLLNPGHVKISLTDDIGRQIGTLVDKQLGPGEYDTYFNAPLWETRPGMYFVLFQLDDQLIVKKIIQVGSIFY